MSGFLEHCASTAVRPRPSITLPDRGPFEFPAPYDTLGVRLTNADDGPVLPTGMSYWQAINAHAGLPYLLVFLGVDRQRGGPGPSLWYVEKATHQVVALGPIFPPEHPLSQRTGEGWYWSATEPFVLYVSDDERLWRYDVVSKILTVIVDITPFRWMGRHALRQWHSSRDGRVHSATAKQVTDDGPWPSIGSIVYREGAPEPWAWFPKLGDLDESQIDPGGEWLLIKEQVDGEDGEDNRIIRVEDRDERILFDRDGAAGHSDSGFGYMVAADNWLSHHNASWRVWPFDPGRLLQGRLVYDSPSWDCQVIHVAHGNARPGSPDAQWVLGSGATRAIGPRANELVMIPLNGSLEVRVTAPTLVDLDAPGGGDDYSKLPKANLCPAGEWALWTSNHGSDRLDAFLVKIPR